MPETNLRSADVLAQALKASPDPAAVVADPNLVDKMAEDAKAVTQATYNVARQVDALSGDRVIYRMTTIFLGTLAVISAIGIILITLMPHILVLFGKTNGTDLKMPEALVAIASAAIGALAGLLSPLGASRSLSN